MLLLQSQSQTRRIGRVGETLRFNSQGPEPTIAPDNPASAGQDVQQIETPAALVEDGGVVGQVDSTAVDAGEVVGQVDSTAVDAALSAATNSSGFTAMFGLESFFGESKDYPNIVMAQELLGYVHDSTGLPWWGAIVAVTLTARTLLFPMAVYQQQVTARFQRALPLIAQVEQEYATARDVYKDPGALKRRQTKKREIYKKHNAHPAKLVSNVIFQAPLFVSFFFGVKDLAVMFPSFASGGFLWVPDLSTPDPFLLLPMAAGLSLLGVLESALRGRKQMMDPKQYQIQLGVQRIICFSMVPLLIGLKYPAGVFVYWIANNLCSATSVLIFNHPGVRNALGLPPLAPAAGFTGTAFAPPAASNMNPMAANPLHNRMPSGPPPPPAP